MEDLANPHTSVVDLLAAVIASLASAQHYDEPVPASYDSSQRGHVDAKV